MSIYLAARYSRRLELCRYRQQLQDLGVNVRARWLDGDHQIDDAGNPIGEAGEAAVEANTPEAAKLRAKFAADDFNDVLECTTLIAFTEIPRSATSRGGRHVEFGMAIGLGKKVWCVGPRENLFYWLPEVEHFDSWNLALLQVDRIRHWERDAHK